MKTLKTILILCAALCFAASCKKQVDMTLKQKTVLENADIQQIAVSHAWPVTVVYDSTQTFVELEFSAYLEPYIKVRMDGTKLEVGFTGKVYAEPGSVFRATVHMNQIEKLEAKEAAQVQCEGVFRGERFEVNLNEAAQCSGLVFEGAACLVVMREAALLTGFSHVGTAFNGSLSGASQFTGQVHASDSLDISLSSASRFVSKGSETESASIRLSDASLLNMAETVVKTMEVELSGCSEATVHVTDLLSGTLKEASTLYYKGNPQKNVECSDVSRLIPF